MKCPNCGFERDKDFKHCPDCDAPMTEEKKTKKKIVEQILADLQEIKTKLSKTETDDDEIF